jgi:non-ribosomal peptide synthetase component F
MQNFTCEELVQHVGQVLSEGLQHQAVAIEEVLEMVQPDRHTNRSPLFQVLFNYAASVPSSIKLGEATLTPLLPETKTAKFELTFSVNESEQGVYSLAIEYATQLFRQETIATLLQQWHALVEQIVYAPTQPLSHLSLAVEPPVPASAPSRLGDGSHAWPLQNLGRNQHGDDCRNNLAFSIRDREFSYQQLLDATDSIASTFVEGENVVVNPVRHSEESYLRCIAALRNRKPLLFASEHCLLDLPNDIAAVYPTSGSSGAAKSVAIKASSLALHSAAFIDTFGLTSDDRVAQYAAMTFDLFLEELLPALSIGASIHVVPDEIKLDPRELARWSSAKRITVLDLPTAVFHLLASEDQAIAEVSDSLRMMIVGGEKLSLSLAQKFAKRFPQVALWNTYGPTEATIICSAHRFDPIRYTTEVPLGQPFANARLVIVDTDGRPVAENTPGELVICGPGVAAGYVVNGELLVRGGFQHVEFGGDNDNQLQLAYATGDKVERTQQGDLLFRGRLDEQVKIRGHRIDPASVAAALRADSRVVDAAVIAKPNEAGYRRPSLAACL